MKKTAIMFALAALLATANESPTAIITDSACVSKHKGMRVGCDARCVRDRVRAGAKYVLWDGRNAYVLSDQKAAEPWAARKVKVAGTLDAKTMEIRVISIAAAE